MTHGVFIRFARDIANAIRRVFTPTADPVADTAADPVAGVPCPWNADDGVKCSLTTQKTCEMGKDEGSSENADCSMRTDATPDQPIPRDVPEAPSKPPNPNSFRERETTTRRELFP